MVTRDKRLHMLLSQEEWAALQDLAERAGITASDWVRLRIREAQASEPPPKRPKPKRK